MDVNSVAIAVGLIVSLLSSELLGLAAGGMVVPGYVALFLHKPVSIALTIVAALATYGCVAAISRVTIVYGKRRTLLMILFGFLIGAAIRAIPLSWPASQAASGTVGANGFSVIGFIIPGLLAIWIDRQGLVETLSALLTTAVVVRLVLILFAVEILV